jgi:hypothetical protein
MLVKPLAWDVIGDVNLAKVVRIVTVKHVRLVMQELRIY